MRSGALALYGTGLTVARLTIDQSRRRIPSDWRTATSAPPATHATPNPRQMVSTAILSLAKLSLAGVFKGADRQPVAKQLLFLGSVKWLENSTFDNHDLAALQKHRARLTDQPVPLVAVSRNGISCSGLQAAYGPEDLLSAWRRA